jgi:hypothetical protein
MPIVKRGSGGLLACLYAIPGAGKTLAAASFIREIRTRVPDKKVLYRDWENGGEALPQSDFPGLVDGKDYDVWRPDPNKDVLDETYDAIDLANNDEYSAVVDDTISSWGHAILDSTTRKQIFDGKATVRGSVKTAGGRVCNVPTMADYGFAQLQFQNYCAKQTEGLTRGMHWLWLAHERLVDIKDGGGAALDIVGGPAIIGSALTREAPKFPHFVGRIKIQKRVEGGVRRIVQTEVDGYYISKDRMRVLNPAGVDVTAAPAQNPHQLTANILAGFDKVWKPIFDRHYAKAVTGEKGE